MSDKKPGLVMLGFDGATWNVTDAMLKEGRLPNIRELMETGVYAKLRTLTPPSTPIIWTTIYTGAEPETHGIRNFFDTACSIKVPRIWDILMHSGNTAGVVGNYFTYPINRKLSFCIPSHFDPDFETYPERYTFLRKMTTAIGSRRFDLALLAKSGLPSLRNGLRLHSIFFAIHSVLASVFDRSHLNTYYRFQRIFMNMWFDIFLHAYRRIRPDFASFYTPLPDTVSHRYWSFHQPYKFEGLDPRHVRKYGNVIHNTYSHCDRLVGEVIKHTRRETQICIVSDHGFQALEDPGNLLVIVPERLVKFLGLKGKVVITNLGQQIIVQPKTSELTEKLLRIFEDSYICDIKRPTFIKFDLNEEANTLRFTINGNKVKRIDTRIVLDGKNIEMKDIARLGSPWTGRHHTEDGIFILNGPGVMNDNEKDMIDLVDVAPTLLKLQGIDVSRCTDGKIREYD